MASEHCHGYPGVSHSISQGLFVKTVPDRFPFQTKNLLYCVISRSLIEGLVHAVV